MCKNITVESGDLRYYNVKKQLWNKNEIRALKIIEKYKIWLE